MSFTDSSNHFAALDEDDFVNPQQQQQHTAKKKMLQYTREKLLSLRQTNPCQMQGDMISETSLDPVCWDSLDAEAIWAAHRDRRRQRSNSSTTAPAREPSNRWQRGVALPERKPKEAETDLWENVTTAATDFSAFGAMPEDDLEPRAASSTPAAPVPAAPKARPLAAEGTTVTGGTNVNVFEDFDEPDLVDEENAEATEPEPTNGSGLLSSLNSVEPVNNDPSSKLMAMIGVSKPTEQPKVEEPAPAWDMPAADPAIPLNPWGGTLLPPPEPTMDLQARIREAERQKAEQLRREKERQGVQNQVERVLMERVGVILENSWGRAPLLTVFNTLRAEDPRVVPLLNTVEALQALLLRNPRRVALRLENGEAMAFLLLTNAQWAGQDKLPRITDAPWYYSDPQKNIQGPFRGEEMRQWFEAGYFKGDLPISQSPSGPFFALSDFFKDATTAFQVSPADKDAEELRKRQEEERLQAEQRAAAGQRAAAERAAAERAAAEQAERMGREEEEKRQAAAMNGANSSSNQLKLMLGMTQGAPTPVERTRQVTPEAPKAAPAPKVPEPEPSKPTAPAWGGAAAPVTRKSMSEIQQEEARKAAVLAMQKQSSRSSSSGWANVAASRGGSTGWSGGAAATMPAAAVSKPGPATRSMSQAKVAPVSGQPMGAPKQRAKSVGNTTAEDFGAKMSPALEKWCRDQMVKLNGTDDLTLVSFCMSLESEGEIREYISAYLGNSPQVTSFANEFISRKMGKSPTTDEWATTTAGKKKSKKKPTR